ncbi:MAG: TetR/AcrR family transcriptional regulator, partial [Clostridium sp.]|nr:TetR/AcrR family transcriptional regulator [Clostridium sp.]
LFKQKGYDQVSVDEIVREAGTAKGTFYIYFESKADVLIYMLSAYDDYYDQIAQQLNPEESVDLRLKTIVKSSSVFTQDVIGLDLIQVLYANQLTGKLKKELYTNRALYRIVHQLLEEGQQKGEYLAEEDSIVLTNRLINWIRGTFFEWCLQAGDFCLETECVRLTEVFCRGIRNFRKE